MNKDILYLGDTALKEAACYLCGVMTHFKIGYDYVPSDQKVCSGVLASPYRAVIVSDYPAQNFAAGQLEGLARQVRGGMGLIMIGGWESFTGPNAEYTNTIMKEVLPVVMQATDDRVNCPQPCLVEKNTEHPIVDGLPFSEVPPGIGGFNRVTAKPEATTVLASRQFKVSHGAQGFSFEPAATDPLLVVGQYGQGRVAAFTSDVAPHWVGGLVDWGDGRVAAQGAGSNAIEVGNWYAEFFGRLVRWAGRMI